MPIINIIKRASNYILGSDEFDEKSELIYEDNEVLFCKNNVCVHPPAFARQESDILHYPGYLTVTTKTFIDQYNNAKRPTLLLTWIPNATLRKCPSTVECNQPFNHFTEELKQNRFFIDNADRLDLRNGSQASLNSNNTNPFLDPAFLIMNAANNGCCANVTPHNGCYDRSDAASVCSINSDKTNSTGGAGSMGAEDMQLTTDDETFGNGCDKKKAGDKDNDEDDVELKRELEPLIDNEGDGTKTNMDSKRNIKHLISRQPAVTSVNITIANPRIQNHDISPEESSLQQNEKYLHSGASVDDGTTNWMTPELFAYKHNLVFPDSATASPIVTRKATPLKCRRFSVDLSQMRSLRLFFNDENCTSGQLVIASRESQYKILHFHHGGLDHLAQVLHQWHCLLHNIKLLPGKHIHPMSFALGSTTHHSIWCVYSRISGQEEPHLPYRQFMVCRPEVKKSELHPDEGKVCKITTDYFYGTLLNEKGQIEDDLLLRKCVFFGGLEKSLRKTIWPFLLHCYSFNSTFEDRAALLDIRKSVRFGFSFIVFDSRGNVNTCYFIAGI